MKAWQATPDGRAVQIEIAPPPLEKSDRLFAAGYAQACFEHSELHGGEYFINGMALTEALNRGPVLREDGAQ